MSSVLMILFSFWSCFQILDPFVLFRQPQKYMSSAKLMIFGDIQIDIDINDSKFQVHLNLIFLE